MPDQKATVTCPNCGASTSGRFCSECGAALTGGKCANCQAELAVGAKFCHRCGTPVGAGGAKRAAAPAAPAAPASSPAAGGIAAAAPWAVAGIALVALVVLVISRQGGGGQAAADAGNVPLAAGGPGGAPGGAGAVDISAMTPQERAERLFNRIMRLQSEGKMDSVQFFAPMAMNAYGSLTEQDADTRYDVGRIGEVAGALPFAKAQADTILKAQPDNLLGLALAMRVARDMGDKTKAAAYGKRLIAAAPTERKKDLPGYAAHKADLDLAVKEASQ